MYICIVIKNIGQPIIQKSIYPQVGAFFAKRPPRGLDVLSETAPLHHFTILNNNFLVMIGRKESGTRLYCGADKPVHIRAYTRVRFGRIEFVREHCRGNWGSRL